MSIYLQGRVCNVLIKSTVCDKNIVIMFIKSSIFITFSAILWYALKKITIRELI